MKNSLLFTCLREERSIFRSFNSFENIGNFELFSSPGLDEVTHWNLAYPTNSSFLFPRSEDFVKMNSYYDKLAVQGHLLVDDSRFTRIAKEESEYFQLNDSPLVTEQNFSSEMSHTDSDLDQFCELIQISFSLQKKTAEYFRKKMELLSLRTDSKFFVIKIGRNIIGGCSTFKTDNGSTFMFNVATHPKMQNRGIGRDIIAYAALKSSKPFYTYSHNAVMRKSILPNLGFTSIGTIWCVPLRKVSKEII